MGRLRSWFTHLAKRFIPEVAAAFQSLEEIPKLRKQFVESVNLIREEFAGMSSPGYRAVRNEEVRMQEARDLFEARMMMGGTGPSFEQPRVNSDSHVVQVKERLWELELALEDRGWKRQLAIADTEFSRYGLQQIILISRLYAIKNPLVKRGVKTSSNYVFGRGFEVSSPDEAQNEAIQEFLKDNKKELGQIGLVEKEVSLHTDGNVFFAFITNPVDGRTRIRSIDATEIAEKICNPDDASEAWFYRRTWARQNFTAANGVQGGEQEQRWYPALDYDPDVKMPTINGVGVDWKTPILQMKIGGCAKWHFGVPDVYCAIDWARAYANFLSHWATITEMLARFSWNLETKGGQQSIEAFNQALSTTLATGGTNIERNPTPVTGAAFVTGPGNKLTPIRTAGATTEPEQGRRIMLMVASAFGLPETFFGDASTGSLATAQSLDRPTELKFLERQEHWREVLQTICEYVLRQAAGRPRGKLRERAKRLEAENKPAMDITVIVKFPAVLEHDIKEMVEAIATATTLDGYTPAGTIDIKTVARLMLAEVGVEDVETVVNAMYPENTYDPEVDQTEPAPAAAAPAPSMAAKPQEAMMYRAIIELRRASEKLLASKNGH
jgi:hypothetical protein